MLSHWVNRSVVLSASRENPWASIVGAENYNLTRRQIQTYSAGALATMVDPRVAQVMREIGIDISVQRSKTYHEYEGIIFDLAVTVCDRAQ